MNDTAARFVILHHVLGESEHWDLMLEQGEVLLTWQLPSEPALDHLPMPARRIADHRTAYLTYEGPVSKNRGHVRRFDAGSCTLQDFTAHRCLFHVAGQRLCGRFVLEHLEGDDWTLRPA